MAELGEVFNANEVKPNEGRDVLPAGEYAVVIVDSERKAAKSGNGDYVSLTLQVAKGAHQNRKLFDNLNLWNKNEKAKQIARGTLSAICRAVGVLTPKDTSELHNRLLIAKVTIERDEERGPQNRIDAYKPMPAAVAPQPTQQAAPQPVAAGGSPW